MMEKTRHQDLEMHLKKLSDSSRPGEFYLQVRGLVLDELKGERYTREELLEALEHFRSVLREREQEEQEDQLLDVMDQLDGWCAPHVRL